MFCEVPLDFTLKAVLEGKTVIEYPTLFFGSMENTTKLKMKVAEISVPEEGDINVEVEDSCLADSHMKDGEKEQEQGDAVRQVETDVTDAVGILSQPNIEGVSLLPASSNKRSISDVHGGVGGEGVDDLVSKVRIVCPNVSEAIIDKEDEVDDEEEGEDDDDDDVFFKALQEFEGKDIDSLKAFIASSEL